MDVLPPTIAFPDATRVPDAVARDGDAVRWRFDGLGEVVDRRVDEGVPDGAPAAWDRTWTLAGRGRVRLDFAIDTGLPPTCRWVVPGVMVDGNRAGQGAFPRGGPEVGWAFREDRVCLPSAQFAYDDARCAGLWTDPARDEALLSATRAIVRDGRVCLAVIWPMAEEPGAYRGKGILGSGMTAPVRRWANLGAGIRATRRFRVYRGTGGVAPWHPALAWWWDRLGDPARVPDWGDIVRRKVEHAVDVLFVRRPDAAGFLTSVLGGVPVVNTLSAGFLGRNLELALALDRIAAETGVDALRDVARDTADFFGGGRLANGLFLTDFQMAKRRWAGLSFPWRDDASTRVMGEAAGCLLRLADRAAARGEDASRWRDQALALGDFFARNLPADGNPGKWWSRDGRRVDDDGTNGAYVVAFLADLAARTGDPAHRAAMARGADFFADAAMRGDLHGDTLDASCIDKEAGHAVQRALLAAGAVDPRPRWLDGARAAARFCDLWTFAWDVPFDPRSPLGRRGFRTTGGTTVSVAHQHLDPYGVAMALEHLRLARATGDPGRARVARWLIDWCAQLVASADDPLGRSRRHAGWQPEQVQHTDWAYWSRRLTPRGSFWSDIAWVPALTLGALLDLREAFPDVVDFRTPVPRLRRAPGGSRALRWWTRVNRVA
jgi:hypothetical protein